MDIRAFALQLIQAETLAGKLAGPVGQLTDADPGPRLVLSAPGRPADLAIAPADRARVPPVEGMADLAQRVRILHAFANHELQATELFAWALLAFPDSAAEFRRGLWSTLLEEQEHLRLYVRRLAELGTSFGDLPVSGYFWGKLGAMTTPLRFVCAMGLTFENANLDHTLEFARAAREVGDPQTAALLERVHADERRHVAFAWRWLTRLKPPGSSPVETYTRELAWPLRAARARGRRLHVEPRRQAGLDDAFIELLGASGPRA